MLVIRYYETRVFSIFWHHLLKVIRQDFFLTFPDITERVGVLTLFISVVSNSPLLDWLARAVAGLYS
jgi:hypothetical protein